MSRSPARTQALMMVPGARPPLRGGPRAAPSSLESPEPRAPAGATPASRDEHDHSAADGDHSCCGRLRRRDAHDHGQPDRHQLRAADRRRHDPGHRPPSDQGQRRRLRAHDLRPGLHEHRVVPQRGHLPRRGRRHPAVPGLSDRAARREEHLPRGRLPARLRRSPDAGAARRVGTRHHPPHVRARERQGPHAGLPLRRPPHGDAAVERRGAQHVLPGGQGDRRTPRTATCRSSA